MSKRLNTREVLEEILTSRICRSHEDIQRELAKRGIVITQASVSRALNRLGAIKANLPDGTIAWRLHKGTVQYRGASPKITRQHIAHHLAERIIGNGNVFVILGKPDSGRYLGTFVDDAALPSVAGTIAGGNTLLVVPFSARGYAKTLADLKLLFPGVAVVSNS